ncbi:A-kinase anchor protein 9-like [Pistacia vera]|uniref:A-kinase anchor protein 9-like n=1 Tax=Pistacia vera TaxID=55513 RepID=UPI001262D383|nr:A-kinase anchor protein 9-like [Pistacia vera]
MFRLHKTRPTKSGERIDFKFSHFKALQVPKGWDRLFVSVISVETGKTIAKSSKALVQNGICQWTETVSESIWVSEEESSKELEDCLFKFVVSMGSARSGILGETKVNMTCYTSSSAVVPVSLPLNKCNHGTVLQVKIHCLTPRIKLRKDESKEQNSQEEDLNAESRDMDTKPDGSDSILPKSNGSSSSKELGSTLHKEEPESRGTSFAASDSHQSYESGEVSLEGENFSSRKNSNGDDGLNLSGGPDSSSSQNNVPEGNYHVETPSESNQSSCNSEDTGSGNYSKHNQEDLALSASGISASTKSLLKAAEDTIQELRAESKMWERNAQKLMIDLDILRKEFSDQSKNHASLQTELKAACTERDGFRNEVEQLKLLLEKMEKAAGSENSTFQDGGVTHFQKEFEDEIKFQKESGANLALQLKRSQESNIELVAVLQELEETIEKQKLEIENLSLLQSKFSHMEESIDVNIEENKNTMLQLQQLQESERNLKAEVQLLEQALEQKDLGIEKQKSLRNQNLLHVETEYKAKLLAKDTEISGLKAKLSEFHEKFFTKTVSLNGGEADLSEEIEDLKAKLQELEKDCNELTDENLELLFKLKEIKSCSSEHNVSHHESKEHNLEQKLKKKVLREIKSQYDASVQQLESLKNELEVKVAGLDEELSQRRSEIERLQDSLLSKEEETKNLLCYQNELEAKVSSLQNEKVQLEENITIILRESEIATKCMNDLRKDIRLLSSSVDSHVSANRILEKKSSELESEEHKLEAQLSEMENGNAELSACISSLVAQVKSLTTERESIQLELENSNALAMNLQDELKRLRNDMETQETDMKKELEEMHNQWSEAQEECEYLGRENLKLQSTANSLIKECSSVQKSNGELKKQKFELQKHCTHLEEKLRESNENFANCSRKLEGLEENLSSMLEDIALKEKSITLQFDALFDENGKLREKLALAESLLTQMHLEKTVEIDNLQQEIANLRKQLSATLDEKKRIASEAEHEVSGLHADNAKLECALPDLQCELKRVENELNNIQIESQAKVQGLMGELAASKQNQDLLMVNHEKLLKQLEIFKSNEEKFKISLNDLELQLTVSEYERQQLREQSTNVKVQLLSIEHLELEFLSLRNELNATISEKEELRTSLHHKCEECEDMKAQKDSCLEKISTLQRDVSKLGDCKRQSAALEEKLLQMEDDLMEKEEIRVQDNELKNELSMIKKANRQLQWKIQLLEEEKDKFLMRSQALNEELKLMKEEKQNQRESSSTNSNRSQHQKEGDNGYKVYHKSSPAASGSKIQLLEAELAKTKEANSTYKAQIKRLSSEGKSHRVNGRKSVAEGEVVTKERFERTKSSLESELRDIRERYLQMSLKYAEVEAQREELVMKLKIAKNGKRWFS